MEIIKRKLLKSIQERKVHNQELLQEGSRFNRSKYRRFNKLQGRLQDYLSGSEKDSGRLIWATLHRITQWHIELGQMLALEQDKHEELHLSQATHYGYWWLKLGPAITEQHRESDDDDADIWLRDACRVISYLLLTGHTEQAAEVSHTTATALNTQFIGGGDDWYVHAWFIFQLVCKWQNIDLDLTDCDIPSDMKIYPQVLVNWDTKDLTQVQQLVNQMADFHIAASKFDMDEDEINDFNDDKFWFFPYEILAWLRIRALSGLPNPETYEHPLMQQPLGHMPPDTPFPEDKLLEQVVAKLKADHGLND